MIVSYLLDVRTSKSPALSVRQTHRRSRLAGVARVPGSDYAMADTAAQMAKRGKATPASAPSRR